MTTETAVADPYADLVNELIKVGKQNEARHEQRQKQEDERRKTRAEERKRTLHTLIEKTRGTLDSIYATSPRFAALMRMEWPCYSADQSIPVLPLFGTAVSPDSTYARICLIRYRNGGLQIKILFQRVGEDVLYEEEDLLDRVPETFDEELRALAEPPTLIARVVAALLPRL